MMKMTILVSVVVGFLLAMLVETINPNRCTTVPDSGGQSGEPLSLGSYEVRAYCPCKRCCGDWATKGYNKQGQRVASDYKPIMPGDRFVASDLPRGTMVHVPGYGTVPVRGHGPSANGKRMEVFFHTHQEAKIWGVKNLTVSKVQLEL